MAISLASLNGYRGGSQGSMKQLGHVVKVFEEHLKTCADPAPRPTRRGLTIPLIVQPLLSRQAPWKQVSFAKMLILGVTPSEPTAV